MNWTYTIYILYHFNHPLLIVFDIEIIFYYVHLWGVICFCQGVINKNEARCKINVYYKSKEHREPRIQSTDVILYSSSWVEAVSPFMAGAGTSLFLAH